MTAQTRVPRARRSEADDLWRLTMEHSPVGMAIVSTTGEFLSANVALCDMLGYEPDAMARLSFQDITHPDDLASDLRLVDQTLAGEISSYRITKRYICADGSVVIGDLSVALLRAPDGTPIHFISQIADLTERQAFVERLDAVEAEVDFEQRKADALFESVTVGLLQIDAEGTYRAYNSRLQEFLDIAFPQGHLGRAGQTGFVYDADQQRLLDRRGDAGGPRGRGGGVRRPAGLDRRRAGRSPRALDLGPPGPRPPGRAHRSRAGLPRRHRPDPRRAGQGRLHGDGVPRAAYAADVRPGLPRAARRVHRRQRRGAPAGHRSAPQHAAPLAPRRRPALHGPRHRRVVPDRPLPARRGRPSSPRRSRPPRSTQRARACGSASGVRSPW